MQNARGIPLSRLPSRLRILVGCAIALIPIAAMETLGAWGVKVPLGSPLLMLAVIVATYIGGLPAGLVGSAATVLWLIHFYSAPGHFGSMSVSSMGLVIELGIIIFMTMLLMHVLFRRIRTQERAQHEFLDQLLENTPVGIAVLTGPDFRYSFVNAANAKITRGKGDVLGRKATEVWSEVAHIMQPILDHVSGTGEPFRTEDLPLTVVRDRGPEDVFASLSVTRIYDAGTRSYGILVILEETTERVLAKQRLERTAAEAEARRSELEAVLASVSQGVMVMDPRGRLLHWNPVALAIHGMSEDMVKELLRQGLRTVDDVAQMYDVRDMAGREVPREEWPVYLTMRGEEVRDYELWVRNIRADRARILSYGSKLVRDKAGEIRFCVFTVQDVTERRRNEEILRDNETRLRLATEAGGMGIWQWDVASRETIWDEKSKALFGLPADARISYDVFINAVHPDDRVVIEDAMRRVTGGAAEYEIEFRVVWPDGTVRFIMGRGRALQDEAARPARVIGIAMDVTERRQMEDALRLGEERFRIAVKNSPTIVYTTDRELRYTWAYNLPQIFASEDVIGRRDDEIAGMEEVSQLLELKQSVLDSGAADRREVKVRLMGEPYYFDVTAEPIIGRSGEVLGLTVAATDVTGYRKVAEDLRSLTETLERRVAKRTAIAERRAAQLRALAVELTETEERERRRLAAMIHDDLQQLLVAAKLGVRAISSATREDVVRAAAERVDELIEQSIRASRSLTSELSPPALYDAGLTPALEWLVNWEHDKYGLDIEKTVIGTEPKTIAENVRVLLFQSVRELFLNVLKHSGVTKAAMLADYTGQGRVRIEVSDKGKGFDFESVRTGEGFAGRFGLFSITERIALAGGSFRVESRPGAGTRVLINVPVTAPSEAGPEIAALTGTAQRAAPPPATEAIRIVIADGNRILREGLAAVFDNELDMEVVGQAASGPEAIDLARRLRPDVAIVDASLSIVSGIEVTRSIVKEVPGTSVIGLSMHEDADVSAAMRDAGASDICTKDSPPEELIASIRGVFHQVAG